MPQRRHGELGAENRRHVAIVEDRIDLDEIQRPKQARVRGNLHHHVRLAIIEPAFDRRADARGNRRVADVHVERQVHAAGILPGDRQCLLGDDSDTGAVDVFHRKHVDARTADDFLLAFIEIAKTNQHRVLSKHLRRKAADPRQLGWFRAEQRRERHAMYVAARRTQRRVHVCVSIHPDEPERLSIAAQEVGGGGHRSRGKAVIAAKHKRKAPFFEGRERSLVQLLADPRDLTDVSLLRIAE